MTDFMCDLPWAHLSVSPHGTTSVCCEATHVDAIGHSFDIDPDTGRKLTKSLSNSTIEEIINCDNYKSIRLDMLAGKIPPACAGCARVEAEGGRSKRLGDSIWKKDWAALTGDDGTIQPHLRSVELRLGNVCNLKCRSCNAESSSLWIKDYYALRDTVELASDYGSIVDHPDYSTAWVDDDSFYDELSTYLCDLDELHISGGEPFLSPKHASILHALKRLNKTDIRIGYHTNLHYDIDRIRPTLDALSDFSNVRMNMSIDDVGKRNEYIRHPSDWGRTVANMNQLTREYPMIFPLVCQTVSVYNFMYIEELSQFFAENDMRQYHYFNALHSPAYLSPLIIPPRIRHQKLEKIKGLVEPRLYDDLVGRYGGNEHLVDQIEHFDLFTKSVDRIRSESFLPLFKILDNALAGYRK